MLTDCSNKITLLYLAVLKMLLTRHTKKGENLFICKGHCIFSILGEMTVQTSRYNPCQALELKCCNSRDLEKELLASFTIPMQNWCANVRPLIAVSPMHSTPFISFLCKWREGGT